MAHSLRTAIIGPPTWATSFRKFEFRGNNISVASKGTIGKQILEMLENLSDICSWTDASCLTGRGFS